MKFKYLILCIFFISISSNVTAISKKESLYKGGKPLEEWSESAGWNSSWLSSCTGGNGSKVAKEIRLKVAKLSWPDFKIFMKGQTKWDQGNYISARCSQVEFNKAKNSLYDYVEYLEYLVNQKIGNNNNNNNCMDNLENLTNEELISCGIEQGWVDEVTGAITGPESNKTSKEQLKALKKLFEEGLITKEVYEKKQLEILSN